MRLVGFSLWIWCTDPQTSSMQYVSSVCISYCNISFRLFMLGGVSPETCWATYKCEIKCWYTVAFCWIFFANYTMMHGFTHIKLEPMFLKQPYLHPLAFILCNSPLFAVTQNTSINHLTLLCLSFFCLRTFSHTTIKSCPFNISVDFTYNKSDLILFTSY